MSAASVLPSSSANPLDGDVTDDRFDGARGAHEDPAALDLALEHLAAQLVELRVHQGLAGVNDGDVQAAIGQHLGGLEAQEAAAENNGGVARAGVGTHARAVVHRPVDEDPRAQFAAGDRHPVERRHQRLAAGGEHGGVVAVERAVGGLDLLGGGVEPFDDGAVVQTNAVRLVPGTRFGDDRLGGGAAEHLAEQDPVVGAALLLAVDDDVVASERLSLDQLVEQAAGGHPVADDGQDLLAQAQAAPLAIVVAVTVASATRTAQTLNSGIRLIGSSAGMVRMLAALLPPQ